MIDGSNTHDGVMNPEKQPLETTQRTMRQLVTDRRAVLRSAGLGGSAVAASVALAACGSSSDSGAAATTGATSATGSTSTTAETSTTSAAADGSAAKASVAASQVSVGGGVIVDEKYVVTQPSSGTYKAFTAICTHQGCPVTSVEDGVIKCPCHGSEFSISDGSVKQGPATEALASYIATLEGSDVKVS